MSESIFSDSKRAIVGYNRVIHRRNIDINRARVWSNSICHRVLERVRSEIISIWSIGNNSVHILQSAVRRTGYITNNRH